MRRTRSRQAGSSAWIGATTPNRNGLVIWTPLTAGNNVVGPPRGVCGQPPMLQTRLRPGVHRCLVNWSLHYPLTYEYVTFQSHCRLGAVVRAEVTICCQQVAQVTGLV